MLAKRKVTSLVGFPFYFLASEKQGGFFFSKTSEKDDIEPQNILDTYLQIPKIFLLPLPDSHI